MPTAAMTVLPAAAAAAASPAARKTSLAPERKYKCQFCHHAFSRSEHRSRHERSHTKERPFKCSKCRSTFVRRDLLLRHDRTVHAKDGGVPLHSEVKRRAPAKPAAIPGPAKAPAIAALDPATLEQIEASSDGMVDLETAAMLMTDLHHKATAAMSTIGGGPEPLVRSASEMTTAPSGHALLEPSVAYGPDAVPLPQMSWDAFMPHGGPSPAKAHSISSSVSGSQDSQASAQSFTSVSTVQPPLHPNQLAPIIASGGGALAPALQTLNGSSLPLAGAASPGPYSPASYAPSPLEQRRSPAPTSDPASRAPQLASDEERDVVLARIHEIDPDGAVQDTLRLPSRAILNRYLSTYFNLFHHHLPFLHPASFTPLDASPALLLAVLSIGALYTFERDQAYMLHIGSKILVNQFLQNKENFSSRKCPLWTMQSSLLNMIFASWSGDPKGLEWACSIKSLLANMVAGNRYELKLRTEARQGTRPSREDWIEDEGCRRTYYAVYIFFGLLTLTYNHTPAISFNEFDALELPSSESLWNVDDATDEESWQERLRTSTTIAFKEAHDNLFQGEATRYSAFATRIMINALFLEVWYHKRSPEALQDVVTEYKLRLALETWERALDLCETETAVVPLSAPHRGHPLLFNALAMFRNTRARLEVDLKSIQEALRYHDPYEVAGAMTTARDRVKRSHEMTKVIQQCFDCVEIAALQGIRWVARTSATNWSVEHALCGMDLIVILSLWLWRLEHDDEPATEDELVMYNKVRALFEDDPSRDQFGASLSSTVARLWGSMLDEVVVWGITRLLGESFRLHAQALIGYEDALAAGSGGSTPSMTAQGLDELHPAHPPPF